MNRIAICVISVLLGFSVVLGQLPTVSILGQVKDASGSLVAGAKITTRNVETGQSRTVVTGDDGGYRLDALPVGNYEIAAEKSDSKRKCKVV